MINDPISFRQGAYMFILTQVQNCQGEQNMPSTIFPLYGVKDGYHSANLSSPVDLNQLDSKHLQDPNLQPGYCMFSLANYLGSSYAVHGF